MGRCGCQSGCACVIQGTGGVKVQGDGSPGNPFAVSALSTDAGNCLTAGVDGRIYLPCPDGSATHIIAGEGVTVTGTGTAGDPYVIHDVDTGATTTWQTAVLTDDAGGFTGALTDVGDGFVSGRPVLNYMILDKTMFWNLYATWTTDGSSNAGSWAALFPIPILDATMGTEVAQAVGGSGLTAAPAEPYIVQAVATGGSSMLFELTSIGSQSSPVLPTGAFNAGMSGIARLP